ncbi:hypothetical protein [Nostoc parmelioides]|uniref:Uncharacterized protein n=1 Tax=Nostoc parmelioides FACHB-3921 TaxID=2692909 RepID=A0ABR8BIK4_9NOSO|nr:hypothetical protein [Nostoc parmelioides]MBD2253745.1 hypothetical protein [Nostoc parmelioides FACHB-3921]
MKKLIQISIIIILSLGLTYHLLSITFPKTYIIDCTQANLITKISDNFISAIGDPSAKEAEIIAQRYITKAFCLNDLKGDSSFSPKPYFFNVSNLSSKYQIIGYSGAGFRSPGNLQVKFDNGTLLNFCFSMMVINCNQAQGCDCPHDFNWEPKPKQSHHNSRKLS